MKRCPTCSTEKPYIEFYLNKKTKDGYGNQCKTCIKSYKELNAENIKAQRKAYRASKKASIDAYNREHYKKNTARYKERHKKWNEANPSVRASHRASYRASKLSATPAWLSDTHKYCIEAMYAISKRLKELTGKQWHVDHIVPLVSDNVCGLHVPWNLRVVEASVNLTKSNKYEEWHV